MVWILGEYRSDGDDVMIEAFKKYRRLECME